jgi:hypothetical protein
MFGLNYTRLAGRIDRRSEIRTNSRRYAAQNLVHLCIVHLVYVNQGGWETWLVTRHRIGLVLKSTIVDVYARQIRPKLP